MTKFIASHKVFMKLHEAGFFKEDPAMVRRVIIDLECGSAARIYYECFADEELFGAVLAEGGLFVEEIPPPPSSSNEEARE